MSRRSISSLVSLVVLAGLSACADTGCDCVSSPPSPDHYGEEADVRTRESSDGAVADEPSLAPGTDRRYYNIPSSKEGLPVYRNN